MYNITLPSMPTHTVEVEFQSTSSRINLVPSRMIFEPKEWNTPQLLVVYALEDPFNMPSPYSASFNTTVNSSDKNFDNVRVPDYHLTVEDNDEGLSMVQWVSTLH